MPEKITQISREQLEELEQALDRVHTALDGLDLLTAQGAAVASYQNWLQSKRRLEQVIWSFQVGSLVPLQKRCEALVEGLSGSLGKIIRWRFEGFDGIELTPAVTDVLSVFALHGIRNAIDHGIETPPERTLCKKPEPGEVSLRAQISGNVLEVTLTDDGAGPSYSKILQKALQQGLLNAEKAKQLESEVRAGARSGILELLFQPGFSSAASVGMVSGRGVGLDAIREGIRELGGAIEAHVPASGGFQLRAKIPQELVGLVVLPVGISGTVFWVKESEAAALRVPTIKVGAPERRLFRLLDPAWRRTGPEWLKLFFTFAPGAALACRMASTQGQEFGVLTPASAIPKLVSAL